MYSDLIFMPLDMPNPPDITPLLDEASDFWPDDYRKCKHFALMDRDGNWEVEIPELMEWAEKHLFTWAGRARMVVITTEEGGENPPHIDCSPEMFHTWQHKFRYVFQGNVSDLCFLTKHEEVYAPEIDQCYMMDGSWPHVMRNTYKGRKYTLALGAPWEPGPGDVYPGTEYISSKHMELPENYEDLYEDRYK